MPYLQPLPHEIVLNPSCVSTSHLIIYADPVAPSLPSWILDIAQAATQCTHYIILRFSHATTSLSYRPSLQGFTVAATLKKTEYKVVDDTIFKTRLFTDCPYGAQQCSASPNTIANTSYQWPEETEKRSFTGIQATQFIYSKAKNLKQLLRALNLFVEDAPSVTRSEQFMAMKYVDSDNEKDLVKNLRSFRQAVGDANFVYINGHSFDFSSLKQSTDKLAKCISKIAAASHFLKVIAAEQGYKKIPSLMAPSAKKEKDRLRVKLPFDKLLPNSLVWLNNMTSDSRYKKWKKLDPSDTESVQAFQQLIKKNGNKKTEDGMEHLKLVKVKSDHLSVILVVDPGDDTQFGYLGIPESIIRADLPIQVALVLVPNGKLSSSIAAGFHYFLRLKGRKTAITFLSMIRQIMQYFGGGYQQVPLSEQIVEMAFSQVAKDNPGPFDTAGAIAEADEEIALKLKEAEAFAQQGSLFKVVEAEEHDEDGKESKKLSLLCWFNGVIVKDVSNDVISLALAEQGRVAKMLVASPIASSKEEVPSFEKWVAHDSDLIVVNRLGRDMKTEERQMSTFKKREGLPNLVSIDLVPIRDDLSTISYMKRTGTSSFLVTVWLASADHESEAFKSAQSFLAGVAGSPFAEKTRSRFAVVEHGSKLSSHILQCEVQCISEPLFVINGKVMLASSVKDSGDLIAEIATQFATQDIPEDVHGEIRLLYHLASNEITSSCREHQDGYRMMPPVPYSTLTEAIETANLSDLVFETKSEKRKGAHAAFEMLAVIDPTKPNSYILASLLQMMQEAFTSKDLVLKVLVAPEAQSLKKHFDQPSTFFKFLLQPKPKFEKSSGRRIPPALGFHLLPQSSVLTVSLEPPRAWFVASYSTNYDMDNVILDHLGDETKELHAEYELQNLIVEGTCMDENEEPPQGLKLILENDSGVSVDTLVMANLGYFQLKVPRPGKWKLRLAPGPSSDIFVLKKMDMYKDTTRSVYSADSQGRVPIPVESLSGAGGIALRVARKEGMTGKSVLNPNASKDDDIGKTDKNVFGRLRSKLGTIYQGKKTGKPEEDTLKSEESGSDTIHVFSVASGHLYERFLKIMISSVTKHASRPVKFWLLENYLSPSFKKVLPHFAKAHGAEVGMVTYRWPGWLRAQTEKQRIIWAYKILFLDVLFPLDVGRIIFVDSDQVIRGDLAELMDIDLGGAPYGYVPFCDSRKEVEGFRFWKTGFWKETLKGAKYRISALYVIDLNRFRETAAGDTLRFIYQSLSADPNSLSNLDQDLPNYASTAAAPGGSVPIFDLPADWLWCETWCDDESKKTAKAIDLCNNPDTKEPKLASAKRIISEWVSYDDAATGLTEKLYSSIHSNELGIESEMVVASDNTVPADEIKEEL